MRNVRIFAMLVALCLALSSLASASSVGPKAVTGGTRPSSGAHSRSLAAPSTTWVYLGNNYFTGEYNAWTINFGYSVANSFSLASPTNVNQVNIATWNFPGDYMTSIGWQFGNAPASSLYGSGNSATADYYLFTNQYGYDIYINVFNVATSTMPAGNQNSWMTLGNANQAQGNPVYWDMNSGPSRAWESAIGYIQPPNWYCGGGYNGYGTCSDAFALGKNGPATPEPSSLMLLGSGLLGLGGVIRRRFGK